MSVWHTILYHAIPNEIEIRFSFVVHSRVHFIFSVINESHILHTIMCIGGDACNSREILRKMRTSTKQNQKQHKQNATISSSFFCRGAVVLLKTKGTKKIDFFFGRTCYVRYDSHTLRVLLVPNTLRRVFRLLPRIFFSILRMYECNECKFVRTCVFV